MRSVGIVLGVIILLVGVVWTLQGLNILHGSVMSGSMLWTMIGPIVAIVGLVLLFGVGLRRRKA
ncbi:MAG: hypothetical protein ACRDID_07945 [Ktedonobacterales bacterium]